MVRVFIYDQSHVNIAFEISQLQAWSKFRHSILPQEFFPTGEISLNEEETVVTCSIYSLKVY